VTRLQPIKLYVGGMAAAAITALTFTDWSKLYGLGHGNLVGWAVLVGVAVVSEVFAIRRLDVSKKTAASSSIMFIPLLASVQLFGPASAIALMAITGALGELIRRKAPLRATFNVAQGIVATCVAGWAFKSFGGLPFASSATASGTLAQVQFIVPFMAFGLVFLALNHAAVALAIALSQHLRFMQIWVEILGHSGAFRQDLLISPIALAVAYMYLDLKIFGILAVFLPLLFVRHAYATVVELRDANRDLLTALIKAIETRDPYTSGHSLRVSHLAERIAELLGLGRKYIEDVKHAAMLHDIGKIEAAYTGILMKPAALSDEERAIIESHVTKGEELLRRLSSVPDHVIEAVRHHHERYDGTGYPDRLKGVEIPLGARIIAVCDAVDAMLSDRPYRAALSVPTVFEQLRRHSGGQFDPGIVEAVIASDLVADYADVMRAPRPTGNPSPPSVMDLPSRRGVRNLRAARAAADRG
jgi:putative nucleotidyltransferase with HDIG domain